MQRAIKELYVTRDDRRAIGKRSPLVTPLGGKVFWVSREFRVQSSAMSYRRSRKHVEVGGGGRGGEGTRTRGGGGGGGG